MVHYAIPFIPLPSYPLTSRFPLNPFNPPSLPSHPSLLSCLENDKGEKGHSRSTDLVPYATPYHIISSQPSCFCSYTFPSLPFPLLPLPPSTLASPITCPPKPSRPLALARISLFLSCFSSLARALAIQLILRLFCFISQRLQYNLYAPLDLLDLVS